MRKIEVIWDESDGTFVVHFQGYAKHDDEHAEIDALTAKLRGMGFNVKLQHYHVGNGHQAQAAGESATQAHHEKERT
jgi:hypothetical protein